MLKKSPFSPAQPRRSKTRLFPSSVLGSSKSSTYPTRRTSCLGSLGWAGEKWYASGFDSLAALLNGLFEHLEVIPVSASHGRFRRDDVVLSEFSAGSQASRLLDAIFTPVIHGSHSTGINVHDANANLRNELNRSVFLRHGYPAHPARPPHKAQGTAGVCSRACLVPQRAGRHLRSL